ncbi:MAG: ATP-grasp domain-containing protein [Bifidobacteriaceae bacterium]|jgi:acetyl-CoA/propionyl-CoA carboxylase biotin carboxyl carrier protein|nr:ATP-grasp domain-containing protein [Bifidobacteriaceae bacterium]
MVFSSLLIANRGEIAVRIARACADAGIRSVAVYAPEDRNAMHVRVADEAFALPGDSVAETYLNAPAIVSLASRTGAEAVHPGYGFLAESAELANAVAAAGLTWIGPPAQALELVSNKLSARALALRAGVPMVPASPDPISSADDITGFGAEHGYPLVIKACYGGGGRGMRVVRSADQAAEALAACEREALGSFGRGECFVERFLERPRHVETQCLADAHGGVAVLSTRDCTVQRRHQKLIEEAPAPFLTAAQESQLTAWSRSLLLEADYRGAATCEFLISAEGDVFFMEINPRLQVEHPVTEEVAGVDLVREQLRLAAGEPLGYSEALAYGHAIEFRINAEDPANGFMPTPGLLSTLRLPGGPGIRCDFGYETGDSLTGSFDSLIGKVIVRGRDRAQMLARARRALRELKIEGVGTVRHFHRAVLESPAFTAATAAEFAVHTRWIENDFASTVAALPPATAADAALPEVPATSRMVVEVDGRRLEVVLPIGLAGAGAGSALGGVAAGGAGGVGGIGNPGGGPNVAGPPRRTGRKAGRSTVGTSADGSVTAPMQGTVVRVAVDEGASVAEGDLLIVLEAMKMEQPLTAPCAGQVTELAATVGQRVPTGHVLCRIA